MDADHPPAGVPIPRRSRIYSGLLRMADLLALQPNMQIRLHIVAPEERRDKVLREIKRPVFSLSEHAPRYEKRTHLSYDAVRAVADIKFLAHRSTPSSTSTRRGRRTSSAPEVRTG